MSILICGGCGFIGSHLCHHLINKGNSIICLDNLVSGKIANIEDLLSHPRFSFIQSNITQPININTPLVQIYNITGIANPTDYQKNPLHTLDTSYIGVKNTLELAIKHQAKILFTSIPDISPELIQRQQADNCNEGKRISETLMMEYHRVFGVNTRIARVYNIYGPNMSLNNTSIVNNIIRDIINNKYINILGYREQIHSLCYIDDLINGLIRLMEIPYHYPINLGNPTCISTKKLIDKLKKISGKTLQLKSHPINYNNIDMNKPDISLTIDILGWKPNTSFTEGLNKTYKYYEKILSK
jgi:UDP-glucuronate decarboxylase